mmetsp:Transcript_67374/g.119459  ORF Transcript_67374/g.119459 Transcript_67374/m.119459 type:complete len:91 (-) Transcript_67374:322-594(-)
MKQDVLERTTAVFHQLRMVLQSSDGCWPEVGPDLIQRWVSKATDQAPALTNVIQGSAESSSKNPPSHGNTNKYCRTMSWIRTTGVAPWLW